MGRITFIDSGQVERPADFSPGESVMTAAVNNNVAGIDGECGGELSCATCHVYLPESLAALVPPPSADELEMLEVVDDPRAGSRLGCQVRLVDSMDGMVVVVAGEGS